MIAVTAILLGLLGSLHCVGMCGPIALALPVAGRSGIMKFVSILLYNLGRAFTYALFGALFGLLGSGFVMFGLQQILSVTVGIIILAVIIFPRIFKGFNFNEGPFSMLGRVRNKFAQLFTKRSLMALFAIGILNGLLPCGLVYIAIAGATASGDVFKGAMFMALFGMGTMPAMLTVSWFRDYLSKNFRQAVNKSMPYLISIMAILMIVRGLNLGIPYLSPKADNDKTISCCEKVESNKNEIKKLPACCKHK